MLVSFLLFFFNESQYKHVHVNKIEKENKFNYGLRNILAARLQDSYIKHAQIRAIYNL